MRLQKKGSISTPTLQPGQFQSLLWNQVNAKAPHWNEVNFDHADKMQLNFDVNTATKILSSQTQNSRHFRRPTTKQVYFHPKI